MHKHRSLATIASTASAEEIELVTGEDDCRAEKRIPLAVFLDLALKQFVARLGMLEHRHSEAL